MLEEQYKNTHEFKHGCTVKTTYWLVPKSNFDKGVPLGRV
jgi:hypothetical protein